MADEQNPNKNQQISRATKAAVSKARSRVSRTKIRDKASRVRTPARSQVNRTRTRTQNKAAKAVEPTESPASCRASCWVASYCRS